MDNKKRHLISTNHLVNEYFKSRPNLTRFVSSTCRLKKSSAEHIVARASYVMPRYIDIISNKLGIDKAEIINDECCQEAEIIRDVCGLSGKTLLSKEIRVSKAALNSAMHAEDAERLLPMKAYINFINYLKVDKYDLDKSKPCLFRVKVLEGCFRGIFKNASILSIREACVLEGILSPTNDEFHEIVKASGRKKETFLMDPDHMNDMWKHHSSWAIV